MTKITPEHLARSAIVYIRQSTPQQVVHNLESQRRQYALVERGRQLGWDDVQVIDDDLGRTGDGRAARPGFEKLLAAICKGNVGAVLSIEASRLARNAREWHTLLEFCGVVDTLILDEDGIYDPRLPNDRLLLGMKGTMSEMELSILRQRAGEARKQKARRGELLANVAVGYSKTDDGRIEKEPDRRVREAIALVFQKFTELQSARQVFLWIVQEQILLPAVIYTANKRSIEWKTPSYRTVYHILTNRVYSGAYAFGRRSVEVKIDNGRKRMVRNRMRHWKDWKVLIRDHHESYITWESLSAINTCWPTTPIGRAKWVGGRFAGVKLCLLVSFGAHVAARSYRSFTAATHRSSAMSVLDLTMIRWTTNVFRSAVFGATVLSPKRFLIDCNHLELRQPWLR